MQPITSTQYLERMNHEIRTSMNSMLGMAELLWETPLTAEQREYVHMFRLGADRLLTLSNGLTDLSSVEEGTAVLEPAVFEIRESARQTVELMSMLGRDKGQRVSLEIGDEVPLSLFGDGARLEQVLVILLRNAMRRSAAGEIPAWIHAESVTGDEAVLRFCIRDTGDPVPGTDPEALFESGENVIDLTRHLDLRLTARLVNAMRGRVWAENLTRGAAWFFTATFPLRDPASQAPATLPADVKPLRILVAEDSEDNWFLVKAFLKHHPHEVDIAENGHIAVEKVQTNQYHMVLMDVEMPVLDGYEATRRIRAWERLNHLEPVPIIALTARTLAEEVSRSVDAGCSGYLPKPVKKHTLLEAIARHSPRPAAP